MKLVYFPVHARAAAIRMLLSHARVEYTDETISFEEFGKRKEAGEYPNGQLPVLCHEGRVLNESIAILRFLGTIYGYYPQEDNLIAWDADATIDFCMEYM